MNRIIIIGASSGLGQQVAKLFLERGWRLGVAARREERLMELKQLAPDRVEVQSLDVTAADAAMRLRELIDRLGGMDLFFYSSGIGKQNRKQGRGHIAAITSIAGTKGLGPAPSYSATKAFQQNYLQALEQQANARGLDIRFTDIRPGFVDTDLLNGDFRYPMMLRPEDVARQIVHAIDAHRHVKVIDWRYALLTALWRRVPRFIWRKLKL